MVTSHLSLRDLLNCHRVNRLWQTIFTSDSSLYQSIDITSPTEKLLKFDNVQALVKYSGGSIRSLKMRAPEHNFHRTLLDLPINTSNKYLGKTLPFDRLAPLFKTLERLELVPFKKE